MLVIYMFAIVGRTLFGENDPHHFATLHVAMLSMFQVSTMDNWNDIMYINSEGCDRYGYYPGGFPDIELCTAPKAFGWVAVIFFVTFTICSLCASGTCSTCIARAVRKLRPR